MVLLAWANTGLLNYGEPSLGYDGSKLVVGHVDGTLELGRTIPITSTLRCSGSPPGGRHARISGRK